MSTETPLSDRADARHATVTVPAAPTLPGTASVLAVAASPSDAVATPEQRARIQAMVGVLTGGDLEVIHAFGREISAQASEHTEAVLAGVRGNDLDVMGAKLGEIVNAARSINLAALGGERSSLPLIGPLIDRFRLKAGAVARHFQDVRVQIDTLLQDVETTRVRLSDRNAVLEDSFRSMQEEHELIGLHIAAGGQAVIALQEHIGTMPDGAIDPIARQRRNDLQAAIIALEKRVADLKVLQHAALQQLPMIRMVQSNNRMLIEKFHTIRELTVPAWKRQFMLALSLQEQRSAVQLANTIDDATNQFLLENARLLKDNTIATARANQRLVIDIDTLRKVHDGLLETVQEVIRINDEGNKARERVSHDLQQMRLVMSAGPARD